MNKNQLEVEIRYILATNLKKDEHAIYLGNSVKAILSLFTKRQDYKGKAKREAYQLGFEDGKKKSQGG